MLSPSSLEASWHPVVKTLLSRFHSLNILGHDWAGLSEKLFFSLPCLGGLLSNLWIDRGVFKFCGVSHLTGKRPDQQDPHMDEGEAGLDLQRLLLPSAMRARHKCVAPPLHLLKKHRSSPQQCSPSLGQKTM